MAGKVYLPSRGISGCNGGREAQIIDNPTIASIQVQDGLLGRVRGRSATSTDCVICCRNSQSIGLPQNCKSASQVYFLQHQEEGYLNEILRGFTNVLQ